MKHRVTHYKVVAMGDSGQYQVDSVLKEYGTTGPDPGREVFRMPIVEEVSREYAEMLQRELTKAHHDIHPHRSDNLFSIRNAVSRQVDMWARANADQWGERVNDPIVF